MELDKMRQDMIQKDIEIDSLRSTVEKLNKVLQQRKQLNIVWCLCVLCVHGVFVECDWCVCVCVIPFTNIIWTTM